MYRLIVSVNGQVANATDYLSLGSAWASVQRCRRNGMAGIGYRWTETVTPWAIDDAQVEGRDDITITGQWEQRTSGGTITYDLMQQA